MGRARTLSFGIWLAAACLRSAVSAAEPQAEAETAAPARAVAVEFFFSPGCDECREVRDAVLADFTNRFAGLIEFKARDITELENYVRLARLQDALGAGGDAAVAIVVDEAVLLAGSAEIRAGLEQAVLERVALRAKAPAGGLPATEPAGGAPERIGADAPPVELAARFRSFTWTAIMAAGLVDGLNPCAFAAIVFMITLMRVLGIRSREVLFVGFIYSAAVFGTYLALGLAGFGVIRLLSRLKMMSVFLRWAAAAAACALALFSFRDAWAFRRSGNAADVRLQLPEKLKLKIHALMRSRLAAANAAAAVFGLGVTVSLLESVCTGQVYLPTLVFMAQYAETRAEAAAMLAFYNGMFIAPLIAVVTAAFFGVSNRRFMDWSRRNVVFGKAFMGLFFLGLAAAVLLF